MKHKFMLDPFSDHEPGNVSQENDGNVVRIADGGQSDDLVTSLWVKGACSKHRIISNHANRESVEARQATYDIASVKRLQFEH